MKLILASGSPRRHEILNEHNISHDVIPSNSKEIINQNLSVQEIAEDISKQKALDVFKDHMGDIILAADTIVSINSIILGKPKDYNDAVKMLDMLQGKKHQVITGVTLIINGNITCFHETTDVVFKSMNLRDIDYYINHDFVYDKAGSYAIQSPFATFVESINGDYDNVVGLPITKILDVLKEKGVNI